MKINPEDLQNILDNATASGEECGCQLVIFKDGKPLVNLASGYTGPERIKKVTEHTLFPVYSCGKAVVSTAVHRLVKQGKLSYDDKVADYWKEFGCNGKEDVRLWHILSHRTGLHQLPPEITFDDMADWEKMCRVMENMTPLWQPGTKSEYQAETYAWLIGETIRRAVGKELKTIISEEIFDPLGIGNDYFFGTDPETEKRCADVDSTDLEGNTGWCADVFNCTALRRSFTPSLNGVCNAYAMAKFYSALITETDGVRLLDDAVLQNATRICRWENDPIPPEGTWAVFGLGYVLSGKDYGEFYGHGGALGAEGFIHRESGIALALVKNRALRSDPVHPVREQISLSLGLTPRVW